MLGAADALRLVLAPRGLIGALDVACANQRGRYYDRWALRTAAACENSWSRAGRFDAERFGAGLRLFWPTRRGARHDDDGPPPDEEPPDGVEDDDDGVGEASIDERAPPLAALSAFGGLAFYRASALRGDPLDDEDGDGGGSDGSRRSDVFLAEAECVLWSTAGVARARSRSAAVIGSGASVGSCWCSWE